MAGEHVASAGDATNDRTCAACASGTFSTTTNAAACAPWSACPPGTIEGTPGSATTDTICVATGWTREFGTLGGDDPLAVAVDAAGNVYVVGEVARDRALPGQTASGDVDAFVRKYDVVGNELWTRQFGSSLQDRAVGVALSGGQVLVAGFTLGALPGQTALGGVDLFVRAYDPDGTELWTRQFGTAGGEGVTGIAAIPAGGFALSGYTTATFPGETAPRAIDALVGAFDDDGTERWLHTFGSSNDDRANAVAVAPGGDIVVVGEASAALPGETASGFSDVFVRAYDAGGTALWTHQLGTSSQDAAVGVQIDSSGEVMIGGYTRGGRFAGETRVGGVDAIVCAYDATGTALWLHQFGTIYDDYIHGAGIDASGHLLVAGETAGTFPGETLAGMSDTFVAAFDASGTQLWAHELGTSSYDVPAALTAGIGGSVVVVGYTAGTFPGQTNAGSSDVYVTVLVP